MPLVAVRIVAPEEVIRARIEMPRDGFSEATAAIYDQMRLRVQAFTVPAVVVDTRFALDASLGLVRCLLEAS